MANALLTQNRYGQAPSWSQMGLEFTKDPLHLKHVLALNRDELEKLLTEGSDLWKRWMYVRKWITEPQEGVARGRTVEAQLTLDEVRMFVQVGQCEETTADQVRSTVNIFPTPEPFKHRRRVIKHTKAFNERFGKESLVGVKLLRAKELVDTVHDGEYAITLDFSSWFDQHLLDEGVRPDFCFFAHGKWYRLTRLPMGMRQAVDIAQTATEILISFDCPKGVRVDAYVDNIRFLGNSRAEVIEAAREFIERCRKVGVTINEVPGDVDALQAATDLVSSTGEFLGADFDYKLKRVRVGGKTIAKLRVMRDVFEGKAPGVKTFTHRNFLAIFGILFFDLQITKDFAPNRYYALTEYSETARRVQRDPGLLESEYKCSASRQRHISQWIDEDIDNAWRQVFKVPRPDAADWVLVTDASGWGWGALLLNTHTGIMTTRYGRWNRQWTGSKRSAWSEPEGVAQALISFFPNGTENSITVLNDSTTAMGAFAKGRSMKFAVNKALCTVKDVFPRLNATFHHIPGVDDIADPLSRGLEMGDMEEATAQVNAILSRLVMGIPRRGKEGGGPNKLSNNQNNDELGKSECNREHTSSLDSNARVL